MLDLDLGHGLALLFESASVALISNTLENILPAEVFHYLNDAVTFIYLSKCNI